MYEGLPDCILLRIYAVLHKEQDIATLRACGFVCKQWRKVLKENDIGGYVYCSSFLTVHLKKNFGEPSLLNNRVYYRLLCTKEQLEIGSKHAIPQGKQSQYDYHFFTPTEVSIVNETKYKCRIVLLGARNVGKTSLLAQYWHSGNNSSVYASSISCICFAIGEIKLWNENRKNIGSEEERVPAKTLMITDTDDPHIRFRADFSWNSYFNHHSFILVFDVTKPETFQTVGYWVEDIVQRSAYAGGKPAAGWGSGSPAIPNGSIIIVANKIDVFTGDISDIDEMVRDCIDKYSAYSGVFYYFKSSALEYVDVAKVFDLAIFEACRLSTFCWELPTLPGTQDIHSTSQNCVVL